MVSRNVDIFIENGKTHLDNREFDKALKCFNKGIDIIPKNNENYLKLLIYKGRALSRLNKFEKVIECLDEALQIEHISEVLFPKGIALFNLGMYEEALKYIDETIRMGFNEVSKCGYEDISKEHKLALVWSYKGKIRYNMDNSIDAEKCFEKSLELDPDNVDIITFNGLTFFNNAEYDKSIIYFYKVIQKDPKHYKALYYMGCAYLNLNNNEEALNYFNKALKINYYDSNIWILKSLSLKNLNEDKKAIGSCDEALKFDPQNAILLATKGEILYKMGYRNDSLKYIDQALKLEPENIEILNFRGVILLERQEYSDSLFYFQKVIEINPEHFNSFINAAVAYFYLNDYEIALDYIDHALEIDKENVLALGVKGEILISINKSTEAEKCFEKAYKLEPENIDNLTKIGSILFQKGENAKSLFYINKALQIDPKNTIAVHINRHANFYIRNKNGKYNNSKSMEKEIDIRFKENWFYIDDDLDLGIVITKFKDYLTDPDVKLRKRAASILYHAQNPFSSVYGPNNRPLSIERIDELKKLIHQITLDLCIFLFREDNPEVKSKILYTLENLDLKDRNLIKPLTNSLIKENKAYLKKRYINLILSIIDDSFENLLNALKSDSKEIRSKSAYILGEKYTEKAVNPLIDALSDKYWKVRFNALESLGKIGDKRCFEAVENCNCDGSTKVRNKCSEVVIKLNLRK